MQISGVLRYIAVVTTGLLWCSVVAAANVLSIATSSRVMGSGPFPADATDTFTPSTEEIHVVAVLSGVKGGTRVVGEWISVDAIATPDFVIAATEQTLARDGDARVHFSLSRPTKGWPTGSYRFRLSDSDEVLADVPFKVVGDAAGTPAPAGGGAHQEAVSAATPPPDPTATIGNLGPPEADPGREWTLMVYLDGDNDLEAYALKDLNEMEAGLPESGVEVVVLVDRARGYDSGFGDWTDARVYRARRDHDPERIASETIAEPGELNMGDPATLAAFVTGAIRRFPARHYALVLWDHGGGWLHLASDHDAPGTAEGSDGLNIPEVGQALEQALGDAGLERLDLIGFDMCLMAQLETAYEVAPYADVMVASQAVEPGDGWPYEQILPAFAKGTLGTRRLGAEIVSAYRGFYGPRDEQEATQSAIDLRQLDPAVKALDAIAAKLRPVTASVWPQISRSLFFAESYGERADIRKGAEALSSADLLDTAKRLRFAIPDFPAERGFSELVDAMDRVVIANYASPRHRLSHGIALYAPVTERQFNPDYGETRLAKDSDWPALLRAIHETQQQHLTAPKVSGLRLLDAQSGEPIKEIVPGGGARLEATIEGENVLWVHALHGIRDEENKGVVVLEKGYVWDPEYYKKRAEVVASMVDLVMPEFSGDRNDVSEELVGMHLYVTDGKNASRATIDASSLTDLGHVAVPVMLKREGIEEHFATVYFNTVTWQAVSVVGQIPQPDGSVASRQVQPAPGDKVVVLFELIPDDGGDMRYLRGETLQWNDGLELLVGRDEPSELLVALRAESIGGTSDFAAIPVKVRAHTAEEKQFIENAKRLKPEDLIGDWQWHGMKDGRWEPIPPHTEIRRSEKDPNVLVARILNPSDPQWKVQKQLVVLDTRLMPTLRLVSFDDDGQPTESMNFTVLVSRWDKTGPRMVLKYLVPKGWLLLWAKKDGQGETETPAAPRPPAVSQPSVAPSAAAKTSLVGTWIGDDGVILVFEQGRYALIEYNEVVDTGTYSVKRNVLTARSELDGSSERYPIRVDGDTLEVHDSSGVVLTFQRME